MSERLNHGNFWRFRRLKHGRLNDGFAASFTPEPLCPVFPGRRRAAGPAVHRPFNLPPPPPRLLEANSGPRPRRPPSPCPGPTARLPPTGRRSAGPPSTTLPIPPMAAAVGTPPVADHRNVLANTLTFNADNSKSYIVGVRAGNDHGCERLAQFPASRTLHRATAYSDSHPETGPDGNTHAATRTDRYTNSRTGTYGHAHPGAGTHGYTNTGTGTYRYARAAAGQCPGRAYRPYRHRRRPGDYPGLEQSRRCVNHRLPVPGKPHQHRPPASCPAGANGGRCPTATPTPLPTTIGGRRQRQGIPLKAARRQCRRRKQAGADVRALVRCSHAAETAAGPRRPASP